MDFRVVSLIGLGYVGMPIAVAFAEKVDVIGFDCNEDKINLYKDGVDPTHEVGDEVIKNTSVEFTADEVKLKEAKFHIVAVPTPVNDDHTPDLTPVEDASRMLGRNLSRGSVVVYESTVYPGVTEEVCVPLLEQESGLKCGEDFKVGYSPERINPGDKVHRLNTITKIVSGMDEKTLDTVAKVYELVVDAGVYRAESIKVAEAAKVIENSQRDINIAFMNELSIIFNKMDIDTKSVLAKQEFTDDVIVSYSDILFEPVMLKTLMLSNSDYTCAVDDNWKVYWKKRYGKVDFDTESLTIDENDNITELGRENPPIDSISARYIGLLKFSKDGLVFIKEILEEAYQKFEDKPWQQSGKTVRKAYMTDLLNAIIESGRDVKAVHFNKGWIEFDTMEI